MSLRAASDKAGRPGWRMRITRWQVRARPRLSRLARAAAHRRQAATALRGHSRRKGGPKAGVLGKQSRAAMAGAGVALRMADRGEAAWLQGPVFQTRPAARPLKPVPAAARSSFPARTGRRPHRPPQWQAGFAADSRAIYPQFFPELIARYAVFTSDAGLMLI